MLTITIEGSIRGEGRTTLAKVLKDFLDNYTNYNVQAVEEEGPFVLQRMSKKFYDSPADQSPAELEDRQVRIYVRNPGV